MTHFSTNTPNVSVFLQGLGKGAVDNDKGVVAIEHLLLGNNTGARGAPQSSRFSGCAKTTPDAGKIW